MMIRLAAYHLVFSLQEMPVEPLKLHIFGVVNNPDFLLNVNRNVGHTSRYSKPKY